MQIGAESNLNSPAPYASSRSEAPRSRRLSVVVCLRVSMRASLLRNRAECLRDGYIGTRSCCSVHSFIVVIEMRALQPIVQHPRAKYQIGVCSNLLLLTFVEERDVRGREATLLSFSCATGASACVMVIGTRSYCPVSAFTDCCDRNACA